MYFKLCVLYFSCFWIFVQGAYKMKLQTLEKCKLPASKLDPSLPVKYFTSTRKLNRETVIVSANFTIAHKAGPFAVSFRGYQMKSNANKDLVFKLEKQDCKSPFTFQLVKTLSVKLDKECYVMPGTYTVDNIDIQQFNWIFSKTLVGAGKYYYELEFATTKGIVVCMSLICDAVEKKS